MKKEDVNKQDEVAREVNRHIEQNRIEAEQRETEQRNTDKRAKEERERQDKSRKESEKKKAEQKKYSIAGKGNDIVTQSVRIVEKGTRSLADDAKCIVRMTKESTKKEMTPVEKLHAKREAAKEKTGQIVKEKKQAQSLDRSR